ncbi:HsdR family type I site-specific deoxyribonuclease [Marseilla massiliensis]|uniref:HsdR family type I site-specific deoxyribonuclease n=1 Tax=Marseilla massiliensis TaxID=1841864 RepID=UPI00201224D5|nr:HsdR family type I site-specific deoxyribonuclease [Marseilla massiliensis]MCL1611750.1 HsdR family type I site-specific deoxyribonuclease [Marseilla massiliensis]
MSNTKFNENTRVQVPAALHLCKLGYTYLDNICAYDTKTNILIDIFLKAVKRLNPGMSGSDASLLFSKIVNIANNDDLGREFYQLLSANSGIKLIDFENPDNNDWHVTTEFTCENEDTEDEFRPDITCFVNGLPLAFIEVKKPNNHEGILAERERINKRMSKSCFRRFFNVTQLMIFSNNQEYDTENRVPIQGAFYCCTAKEKAFFNVFREENKQYVTEYPYQTITDDTEYKVLKHRNCVVIKNLQEYQTNKSVTTPTNRIITSMLSKERFLFLLRYGIAYVERKIELDDGTQGTELQKHIMRYQQMFASYAIRKTLASGIKSGIIWHTQGSGKTALAYYNVKFLTDYFAKRDVVAKFYFIVDRIDLMEQASDEFAARGLIVHNAKSRDELMQDISNRDIINNNEGKLEITVVNIQKFKEDKAKVNVDDSYNTRLQRIFFIDEAHRGYNPTGSFLANLLEADKNAVKIALTGTPLLKEERESWRVFGDYIHTYYYDKSIADGYTCKLMREPVETIYKEKIENILDKLAGEVEVKKSDVDRNKIMEHDSYLNALLDYIISDFRRFRKEQNDEMVGAMIVCRTNPQARELYRLWQERFSYANKINQQREIQVGIAAEPMLQYGNYKPLVASLILHDEGDKTERKEYIEGFKKLQEVDVLIVNKMLLTGFDAPRLKKLYLGRSLDGHDLLQALTRVNRPYRDFKYGYVVDFVNIKENFDATNDRYLRELNRTSDESGEPHTENIANDILVSKEDVEAKIKEVKSVLFNFTTDNMEEFRKEIDEIESKDSLYELRNVLSDAKAIINQVRSFGDEETKKKLASLPLGTIPTLITEVTHRIERINLFENTEHKADVSGIINVALSELEFEFKKGIPEELRIIVNDIRERCERVQAEFEANFDTKEDRYVILADEFREYFRKKGFVPQTTEEAKASIRYMDEVMKKIREINRRNNVLKRKYKGDERFVRIHKRIEEQNQKRERPIISSQEYEIAENLAKMKDEIDRRLFLDINILDNVPAFQQDVLAIIGKELLSMNIRAELKDRKYINNLITTEYLQQRNYAY